MNRFYMPTADSPIVDWLIFAAFLLPVCLAIGGLVMWLKVLKSAKSKRKRRKHHHHRPINPTLAQTGGLPPKRDPGQAPPGP